MPIRINNLTLSIDEDLDVLKTKVCKKLRISEKDIKEFSIVRQSIDARKKNLLSINYTVEVKCDKEDTVVARANDNNVRLDMKSNNEEFEFGTTPINYRPIVVGMGPAGLFAGLVLAQNGYKPLIIERGESVEERSKTVDNFWRGSALNVESNVQFGEGGAGTFSDGKLTTRIKDRRCDLVVDEFIKNGAPEEIKYLGKPHIGTDILKDVVVKIRKKIIENGGEVRFNSRLQDIIARDGEIEAAVVNGEKIPCDNLILAIGHSSRDTYEMLYKNKIFMEPKAFAIGVRIEHSQDMINESQYGKFKNHPKLKAADYTLTHNTESGRGVYSFCMCPGGVVVAAASEDNRLVTNGMSYYKRDKDNANAAMVVTVGPKDFDGDSPLSGMEFQRHYEALAYKVGGGNYHAPVQLVGDFMKDIPSTKLGAIKPSYDPGYNFKNLKDCLPSQVIGALKEGLTIFDKKIKGYGDYDAVMTGIETRTSAPVKITRTEALESISVKGLYPCGEGAGFAGGIMSAAVDGIKCAEAIMKKFKSI